MARGKSAKRGKGRGKNSSGEGKGKMVSIVSRGYNESLAQINKLNQMSQSIREAPRVADRKLDDLRFALYSMNERQRSIKNEIELVKQEVQEEANTVYRILSQFTNLRKAPELSKSSTKIAELDKKDSASNDAFVRQVKVSSGQEYEIAQSVVFELMAEKELVRRNSLSRHIKKAVAQLKKADADALRLQTMGGGMVDNSEAVNSIRNSQSTMVLNTILIPMLSARSSTWARLNALSKASSSGTDAVETKFKAITDAIDRSKGSDAQKSKGWFSAVIGTEAVKSIGDLYTLLRELSSELRKRASALLTLKGYFSAASKTLSV